MRARVTRPMIALQVIRVSINNSDQRASGRIARTLALRLLANVADRMSLTDRPLNTRQ